MFIPFGKKEATIKKYDDYHIICEKCGHKNQRFFVIQEFFFIFFIPITPTSIKIIRCECLNCKDSFNSEKKNYYLSKTKTPLYFYSGFLFVALILLIGLFGNILTQVKKTEYVETPIKGDVYLIINYEVEKDIYYYFKVNNVMKDSLELLRNNIKYKHFVAGMNDSDYFSLNEKIILHRKIVKLLLDKGLLNTIKREYDKESRFRIEQ